MQTRRHIKNMSWVILSVMIVPLVLLLVSCGINPSWDTIHDYHRQIEFKLPFGTTKRYWNGGFYFVTKLSLDDMTQAINNTNDCKAEIVSVESEDSYRYIHVTVDRAEYI
jgi:hypothetical protein